MKSFQMFSRRVTKYILHFPQFFYKHSFIYISWVKYSYLKADADILLEINTLK